MIDFHLHIFLGDRQQTGDPFFFEDKSYTKKQLSLMANSVRSHWDPDQDHDSSDPASGRLTREYTLS